MQVFFSLELELWKHNCTNDVPIKYINYLVKAYLRSFQKLYLYFLRKIIKDS